MTPVDSVAVEWVVSTLLLSLRFGPTLVLSPPFTLVRAPSLFRILTTLALSALIVGSREGGEAFSTALDRLLLSACRELVLGIAMAAIFHMAFGAIYVVGRTVDIQVGYGLAAVADPTSRVQVPLVGTVYAYVIAAVFFAMNGHHELVRIIGLSLDAVPIGAETALRTPGAIAGVMGAMFMIAFGVAGAVILALFIVDVVIALLARTAPQINALVMGFQVKSMLLMAALPLTLGVAAALCARLAVVALESLIVLVA